MPSNEHVLSVQVSNYLATNYPNVVFHHDFGSGTFLTKGQANRQFQLNQTSKGWPDLFIAQPKNGFYGLFIEIKTSDAKIYKKDGTLRKNDHLENQHKMLLRLQKSGYRAVFGVGLENIKEIIVEYLGVNNKTKEIF